MGENDGDEEGMDVDATPARLVEPWVPSPEKVVNGINFEVIIEPLQSLLQQTVYALASQMSSQRTLRTPILHPYPLFDLPTPMLLSIPSANSLQRHPGLTPDWMLFSRVHLPIKGNLVRVGLLIMVDPRTRCWMMSIPGQISRWMNYRYVITIRS